MAHYEQIALLCFLGGILAAFASLVLGIWALVAIGRSRGRLWGRGFGIVAILISALTLLGLPVILFAGSGPRPHHESTSPSTYFGDFSVVESTQPPAQWFDGGGISGVASGQSGPGLVVADDSELVREWVKKVGFRDTAARHIAAVSIRDHRQKGTDIDAIIWFADVDSRSNPADVLAMRREFPGEVTMQSGRFLMGIYCPQHPRGAEFVEKLVRYYSDEITRVERSKGSR